MAIEIIKEKSVSNCIFKMMNYNDLKKLFENELWRVFLVAMM